mmetsp:Transcript_2484/g.3442  ORF Transcript_2484/g.3442 Transcript_2484/m.3442 type:complete len:136 (-) Transcript_2484:567-974(-)
MGRMWLDLTRFDSILIILLLLNILVTRKHKIFWLLFSIAFIFRPIGGALIGGIGYRFGRKPAFRLASVSVVASTALQGALPSERAGGALGQQVGLVGIFILRITKGLGIGGELGSVIIYLGESSPAECEGLVMAG